MGSAHDILGGIQGTFNKPNEVVKIEQHMERDGS